MLGFAAFEPARLRVVACFWCLCARLAAFRACLRAWVWLVFLGRLNRSLERRAFFLSRIALYRDKPQVKLDNP